MQMFSQKQHLYFAMTIFISVSTYSHKCTPVHICIKKIELCHMCEINEKCDVCSCSVCVKQRCTLIHRYAYCHHCVNRER